MGRWIDISMAITDGLRTNSSKPGEEARITYDVQPTETSSKTVRRLNTRLHIGTHIDGPEHLVRGGRPITDYPLDTFTGRAWVADFTSKSPGGEITPEDLDAAFEGLEPWDIAILRTDWNENYTKPNFFSDSPYLRPGSADWFVSRKTKMVVIDFIDSKSEPGVKHALLEAGIPTMTNADNLGQIQGRVVTLYAFPLKVFPSEAGLTRAVVWED